MGNSSSKRVQALQKGNITASVFINKEIQKQVKAVSKKLNLDPTDCLLLLRKYQWNYDEVIQICSIKDPKQLLVDNGIICNNDIELKDNITANMCKMCMDKVNDVLFGMECGHKICRSCWIDYLRYETKTKACVFTICPQYKCNLWVRQHFFETILAQKYDENYQRYLRFCRADFVEHSTDLFMCPAQKCEMIFEKNLKNESIIQCPKCNNSFCPKCKKVPHFGRDCNYKIEESSYENIKWILRYTKSCPRCHRKIQKNQGSLHMTCRKSCGGCGAEFCWHCLKRWKIHGSVTGGYYQCHIYDKELRKYLTINTELMQYYAQYRSSDLSLTCGDKIKLEHGTIYEKEFVLYQLARIWLNDQHSFESIMKLILNFHSTRQNAILLCGGLSKNLGSNYSYIPMDIIECCLKFIFAINASDNNIRWDEGSAEVNSTIKHRFCIFDDEQRSFTADKTNFITLLTVQSKLVRLNTCNVLQRYVWNVRITWLNDEISSLIQMICIAIYYQKKNDKTYTKCDYEINGDDFGTMFKSGGIVSVLMLYCDSHVLVKFAVDNRCLDDKTIISLAHISNDGYCIRVTLPENMKAELL